MKEFATRGWKKKTTLSDFLKHLKEHRRFFSKILLITLVTQSSYCAERYQPDLWPANSPDLDPVDSCTAACIPEAGE